MKLIVKQIFCVKLVKYWDKYTEMHGQQNVKNHCLCFADFITAHYLVIQPYFRRNLLLNNGLPVNLIPTPSFNLMYTHTWPSG